MPACHDTHTHDVLYVLAFRYRLLHMPHARKYLVDAVNVESEVERYKRIYGHETRKYSKCHDYVLDSINIDFSWYALTVR